jgi:NitT/TauT family transport system permease protein
MTDLISPARERIAAPDPDPPSGAPGIGGPAAWVRLSPLVVALALVLLWAGLSRSRILPASVFPSPPAVAACLWDEIGSGRLADDAIASLFRVSAGFGLAVAVGIPLGLWLGCRASARAALLPAVNFFRSLSPLAWIPFAILWFGIGDAPAIFLIFMATVFPMALSTVAAVSGIPSVYLRVARDFGIRGPELVTTVVLPAILPQVIVALRVTAGLAWLVVVAAEMIAGRDGLGFAIWDARNGLRMDQLVAEMVAIGIIGVVLDRLLLRLTTLPNVRWGYER